MQKHCLTMKDHKGKTTGIMMEGSAMHMSMLHKETDKQEAQNLLDDTPVQDKASAMEMSPYKMGHKDSPAEFTGMSGGSALHQEEKKVTKKDSVSSEEDKDLKMMKKLKNLNISFASGKDEPTKQIKKELNKE